MSPEFSQQRSDAIREELVANVADTTRSALEPSHQRWLSTAGVLAAGIVVGSAVSAAALSLSEITDLRTNHLPGSSHVTSTGEAINLGVVEQLRLPLNPEDGATHVRVTVSCASAGFTSWGTAPSDSNPVIGCSGREGEDVAAFYDFPLTAAVSSTASPLLVVEGTASLHMTLTYLSLAESEWGVNDSGATFGVTKPNGEFPELQAATGVDVDGNLIGGYVRTDDLNAFGPEWASQPSSPDEAARWQEARSLAYPDGWDIPLYRSDGVTQIGTFRIQMSHIDDSE